MEKPIVKLSRCPNGTRRNQITKICEPNVKPNPKKSKKLKKSKKSKKSRCPNGTRRNKITNICEPIKVTPSTFKPSTFKPSQVKSKTFKKQDSLKQSIISNTSSYSPTINKNIVSVLKSKEKTTVDYKPFFGCNSYNLLQELSNKKTIKDIEILNNNNKCISAFSVEGQQILLNNLKLINKINSDNIIVPKQVLSNCWFNCFLMTFFISDKGRRFFRFFRMLMIKGTHLDNKLIRPIQLRRALMLLNIAIEACYNYDNNYTNKDFALNTNTIIKTVYDAIGKDIQQFFPKLSQPGNPLEYYIEIVKYLDINNIINIHRADYSKKVFEILNKKFAVKSNPHIVIIEQYDYQNRGNMDKVIALNDVKYKLDSIIIRSTNRQHFICCFHCNNAEMIYDGASTIKLRYTNWSLQLNENKMWTLPYKHPTPIVYNFLKCYALYFYFRI